MKFYFLLVSYLQVITCCQDRQFLHNGICCDLCPAGTRVATYCRSNASTKCTLCVAGTYAIKAHNSTTCIPCQTCKGEGLMILRDCKRNAETICTCKKGYYCNNKGRNTCWSCKRYTICNPGQGIRVTENMTSDVVCEECPDGTFSDKHSISQVCTGITNCHALGMIETMAGTKTSNAKCIYPEVIIIPIVVLAVLITAAVIFWKKQWLRCGRAHMLEHSGPQQTEEAGAAEGTEAVTERLRRRNRAGPGGGGGGCVPPTGEEIGQTKWPGHSHPHTAPMRVLMWKRECSTTSNFPTTLSALQLLARLALYDTHASREAEAKL
ncbi:tumor necrosis factor receptor superfamily member 5-like isoform X1 [Heterodontus francisci]|uniref:tumor necrosis factor receptor superfamily member 5-like isoform X1 n=1 Tax=Heterodontus francisci TaxID=7792 RepID=UPI00355C6877